MTSASADDAEKLGPGRIAAAIVLALFAVAFFVFTCVYLTTPDYRLPAHLGFRQSSGHHSLRGVACFLIGIAFAIGAWFALRYRSLALEEAQEAERTALAEAAAAPEATAVQVTAVQVTAAQATAGTKAEAGTGIKAGTGVKAGTEAKAGTGVKAGPEAEAGTGVKAGTGVEAGIGVKAGTEAEAGTGVKAGPEAEAGTGVEAGTSAKAGTEAKAGTAATVGDAVASPGSVPGQSDGPGQQPTAASQA
ncbi:MAG TPA: hypothetical protein VH478_23985 [Trebonia sp.]|nr:hypothetical protein [Trebonia sp.]